MVSGFGFRVSGFGFRVEGWGFRVSGSGFKIQGLVFGVQGPGFGLRVTTCGTPAVAPKPALDEEGSYLRLVDWLYHSTLGRE